MATSVQLQQIKKAAEFLKNEIKEIPQIAFVLGSGLGSFANQIKVKKSWRFADIPHFSNTTVEGHPGKVIWGTLEGASVLVQQGRLHAYEGLDYSDVVFPIRLWSQLGIKNLVVTNASGGLLKKMKPGDFMIIKDQINLTGHNPLRGENISELGPRFVDMTEPFDKTLSQHLASSLKAAKAKFHQGVYVGVMGPSYETAAEIKFFQKIGGGAVGMSTVAEVLAARHCGMKTVGVSCITNLGTGLSKHKLAHEDVKLVAEQVEKKFAAALKIFTKSLVAKKLI